ncbi:alpha-L-fucosidase [Bifidobacterium panos]|uniref:alpha-L-fucosidase n=1 Tax=Bifidobacterium panos TaxID=2675321 RepID=A0ABX1SWF2_9BIFI|nr:alpha-L-fucosidase [Bifidobacterium sp. DSM 109963]NMN02160.1 alpha-L-fucosidase [Bifidobacterium sp. DSM 109963]
MIDMKTIEAVIASGPYTDTWESLSQAPVPAWFPDAKFGIFTHWGLYTVPEYRNEWYSRNMYIEGYPEFEHHVKTYGPQKEFGYKDFIGMFTAAGFDANEWLDLFKASGAQYYFPVSEHHDGYQMYRSELSHWNTWETGPHRDIIGELREATLKHGMHFATSNHRAEHWWFMGHGKEFDSDVKEPLKKGDFYWPSTQPEPHESDIASEPAPTAEYLEDWLLRVCEIIDNYRPELLYFDWWVQHQAFKPYMKKLAAFYYNRGIEWGTPVSICYKHDGLAWGAGIVDVERGGFGVPTPFVWQTDTAIARNSWCYTDSLEYKSLAELIVTLVDTVSKNGNLLLNVGPRADGSIAEHDRELLAGIGTWMKANGEGIYGTRPWHITGEGPTKPEGGMFSEKLIEWTAQDWRFTTKNGAIYAFCLNPAGQSELKLSTFARYHDRIKPPFNGLVTSVEQLGAGEVSYERTDDGMTIRPIAREGEQSALPIGFKINVG